MKIYRNKHGQILIKFDDSTWKLDIKESELFSIEGKKVPGYRISELNSAEYLLLVEMIENSITNLTTQITRLLSNSSGGSFSGMSGGSHSGMSNFAMQHAMETMKVKDRTFKLRDVIRASLESQ